MKTIRVTLIDAHGGARTIEGRIGKSLMEAALSAGIDGIVAECGGTCTCATCHVYVDPAFGAKLPPPDSDERALLAMTAAPATADSRLACQITLDAAVDGLVVRLPDTQY